MGIGMVGVLATTVALAAGGGHARPHHVVFGTAASNRRIAEREATRELRSLRIPPSAHRVPESPAPYLEEPVGTSGDPNEIDRRQWLVASTSVNDTFEWLRAHPPADSHPEEVLTSRPDRHEVRSVWFAVREHSRRVSGPSVIESVAQIPGRGVGILVEVRQDWKTPHPAAAKVPSAARIIDVSRESAGGTSRQVIRSPRRVRRIAHVIDQLPATQPEINYGCGVAPSTVHHVRVKIRFRHYRSGPVLAEAEQAVPLLDCESMRFTVRGDPRTFTFDDGSRVIELLHR